VGHAEKSVNGRPWHHAFFTLARLLLCPWNVTWNVDLDSTP
jgi:hypothetical protein